MRECQQLTQAYEQERQQRVALAQQLQSMEVSFLTLCVIVRLLFVSHFDCATTTVSAGSAGTGLGVQLRRCFSYDVAEGAAVDSSEGPRM